MASTYLPCRKYAFACPFIFPLLGPGWLTGNAFPKLDTKKICGFCDLLLSESKDSLILFVTWKLKKKPSPKPLEMRWQFAKNFRNNEIRILMENKFSQPRKSKSQIWLGNFQTMFRNNLLYRSLFRRRYSDQIPLPTFRRCYSDQIPSPTFRRRYSDQVPPPTTFDDIIKHTDKYKNFYAITGGVFILLGSKFIHIDIILKGAFVYLSNLKVRYENQVLVSAFQMIFR